MASHSIGQELHPAPANLPLATADRCHPGQHIHCCQVYVEQTLGSQPESVLCSSPKSSKRGRHCAKRGWTVERMHASVSSWQQRSS